MSYYSLPFLKQKKKCVLRNVAASYLKSGLEQVGMSDMETGQETCKNKTVVMKD
jgi:hypothetical protein